jgi:hypothetical protein
MDPKLLLELINMLLKEDGVKEEVFILLQEVCASAGYPQLADQIAEKCEATDGGFYLALGEEIL